MLTGARSKASERLLRGAVSRRSIPRMLAAGAAVSGGVSGRTAAARTHDALAHYTVQNATVPCYLSHLPIYGDACRDRCHDPRRASRHQGACTGSWSPCGASRLSRHRPGELSHIYYDSSRELGARFGIAVTASARRERRGSARCCLVTPMSAILGATRRI